MLPPPPPFPRLPRPRLLNVFHLFTSLCAELVSPKVFLAPGSWVRHLPPRFHPAFARPPGSYKYNFFGCRPGPEVPILSHPMVPPQCPQSRRDSLGARPLTPSVAPPPPPQPRASPSLNTTLCWSFGLILGYNRRCLSQMGAGTQASLWVVAGSWALTGCHLALGTPGEGALTWQTQQEEPHRSHPDSSDGGAVWAGMQPEESGWCRGKHRGVTRGGGGVDTQTPQTPPFPIFYMTPPTSLPQTLPGAGSTPPPPPQTLKNEETSPPKRQAGLPTPTAHSQGNCKDQALKYPAGRTGDEKFWDV